MEMFFGDHSYLPLGVNRHLGSVLCPKPSRIYGSSFFFFFKSTSVIFCSQSTSAERILFWIALGIMTMVVIRILAKFDTGACMNICFSIYMNGRPRNVYKKCDFICLQLCLYKRVYMYNVCVLDCLFLNQGRLCEALNGNLTTTWVSDESKQQGNQKYQQKWI